MITLLTTDQVLKLTGIPRPNLNRYLSKGWVVPTEQGGGRGKPNKFRPVDVTWAIVLRELFNLWPNSGAEVYLFQDGYEEGDPRQWHHVKLKDGKDIQDYILANTWADDMNDGETRFPMIVDVGCGYIVPKTKRFGPYGRRFVEISLRPAERSQRLIKNWFKSPFALASSQHKRGVSTVMASMSFIHLSQTLKWVLHEARLVK